jgi:hypothetical protein
MGKNHDEAVATPMPSPRLELIVGIAAKSAVLALLPAWVVWFLTHTGPFPTWSWVVTIACPAVITAYRVRWRRERTAGGPSVQRCVTGCVCNVSETVTPPPAPTELSR